MKEKILLLFKERFAAKLKDWNKECHLSITERADIVELAAEILEKMMREYLKFFKEK